MMRFFALCLLFVLVLGPMPISAEEPVSGPEVWLEGEPTPQSVIDTLGFDPATVPDAPPAPKPEEQAILDKAQAAYDAGDFKAAHDLWLPLAEAGVAEAQHSLGSLYHFGEGQDQDDAIAVSWYKKSARQGTADSIFNIGNSFYDGGGLTQNFEYSAVLFFQAARRGSFDAHINLAMVYLSKHWGGRNFVDAYKWLYLAGDDAEDIRTRFIVYTTQAQREAGRKAASQYSKHKP